MSRILKYRIILQSDALRGKHHFWCFFINETSMQPQGTMLPDEG
jgi:hypothetical protein